MIGFEKGLIRVNSNLQDTLIKRGKRRLLKQKMSHNYGDCYFCGGEVVEKVIELEYRWKGRLYIIEGVPVGVCQQCGEKYFTAQVSETIDRIVEAKEIKKTVRIPVKEFKPVEAL